jgi:hypothetical protein
MVNLSFLLIMGAKNVREAEGQNLQVAQSQPWFESFLPYIYTSSSFTPYSSALKMEADGSSKMLVIICQTTQGRIQEDRNLHAHHCKNPQMAQAKMFFFADVRVQCHKYKCFARKSIILSISNVCILICSVRWLSIQLKLQNLGLEDWNFINISTCLVQLEHNQNASFGIIISYLLDGWGYPCRDKIFSSLQNPDQLCTHSSYYPILWRNSPHNLSVFKMQKLILHIMTKVRHRDSCRQLFRNWGILPF